MIHDLADLEPLLRQYHPEKVLVGPLLNLWTNSSFRVFKIAGSGGKIYETVGLGFVKVEADAQLRRADIVAVLESRFGEVQTFDSQLEMAQAAHTLWANDETAGFWQPPQRNQGCVRRPKLIKTRVWTLPLSPVCCRAIAIESSLTRQPAVRSRLMPCRRMHSHRHAIRHSRRLTCPSTRIYRLIAIYSLSRLWAWSCLLRLAQVLERSRQLTQMLKRSRKPADEY